jgi:alkylation response protein AidB-like acyl-CoA dehydrogenase
VNFTFEEDQLLFQSAVRDFLEKECTAEVVRSLWASDTGHSPELWRRLAELGIPGLRVPEDHGGMGMDEISSVLLFEEAGRAALPEPVIATAAVAAPLLVELGGETAERWLEPLASGEAIVVVADTESPLVGDAHLADLLLLREGDAVHAVSPDDTRLSRQPANDPARRLFRVDWSPRAETRVADGETGRALWEAAFDRGALAVAAEQIGVADRLISLAAAYACQREQFGKPIGSFQAVKHMLATVKVQLEYARPAVHRAAWSVACADAARPVHVSLARLLADEAAARAARTALQVHGAIGYTWEQDLHLWMRRAWSLGQAWGRQAFHRERVGASILSDHARLGPGSTFSDA